MLAKRILLRGSLLACFLVPVGLFSQTSPPPASSATQQVPPGWVDGAKNPELIPDHASYRLVLIHLSSMATARQDTRIQMIGLQGGDAQTLKNEVALFKKEYDLWKAKVGAQPPSDQDDKAAKAMVLASRAAILNMLSPSGASKLSQYVEREKTRMVVKP